MSANEQPPIHYIEKDLSETWVADWAKQGVDEAEAFLGQLILDRVHKRAGLEAFNTWLMAHGMEPDTIDEVAFGAIPSRGPAVARTVIKATFDAQVYAEDEGSPSLIYRPANELLGPS